MALKQFFATSSDGMLLTDAQGFLVMVNPELESMFGYARGELQGRPLNLLIPQRVRPSHDVLMADYVQGGAQTRRMGFRPTLCGLRKDGSEFPIEVTLSAGLPDGAAVACAIVRDASERAAFQQRIAYLSQHDAVTGLPNRNLLLDRIELMLGQVESERAAGASDRFVALMVISLQPWRLVLQAQQFDQALDTLVSNLHDLTAGNQQLARLGTDELALTCVMAGETDLVQHLEAVRRVLVLESGLTADLHYAMGVALAPQDAGDAPNLLKCAEVALLQSLAEGAHQCRFYSAQLQRDVEDQVALEGALNRALARQELALHYQPKVEVATGRVIGAEALMRWTRQDGTAVSPVRFIPLAEAGGQILPIGAWALRQACVQALAWQVLLPGFVMAVNLSPRQLAHPDLVQEVSDVLQSTGLPPACLELEITESAMIRHPEAAAEVVRQLQALGVSVALDDFGTGYSSLSYLTSFPFNTLKLDRSFVQSIVQTERLQVVVQLITSMAHALEMEVVAEGVEFADQLHMLSGLGCRFYQGYLCSPAVDAQTFGQRYVANGLNPQD
jgi:PAS domain S-box-containing protein